MAEQERLRDYDGSDDDMRLLMRIIAHAVNKKDIHIGYNEGGNGEKTLLKWLLGLSASLVVVSIVGGVTLYGKVSAIEANQVSQQRQLDQLSTTVATLRRGP